MPDIIRIKRRVTGALGAPPSLENAELAYNEQDHILYYGEGTGGAGGTASVIVGIGGQGLASSSLPLVNAATALVGTATTWAHGDHVHPFELKAGGTMTGLLILSGDPVAALGAATKQYVDGLIQGIDTKSSVKAASTGTLTLSAPQTVDGIALIAGDRVLVKDQAAPAQNGVYIVTAGAWTRALDLDTWTEFPAAYVFVEQGTVNADSGWLCTVDAGGTLGTTAVTWTQFSGAGSVTAGAGLTKTGSQLDVVGTANRIIANADSIDIHASYVGQTSITTLGTIATGTWSASTIAVNRGGSGATTLTGYLVGNGTSPFTAVASIPNTAITGLGTMSTQNANAVAITGGTIDGIVFDGGSF